ncbi:DNRLRE domain-containing protein [Chloroflexi bacterium TSY]|nr:DNRLRE domain-containing protein [Chloroflexi bacterium TSY]
MQTRFTPETRRFVLPLLVLAGTLIATSLLFVALFTAAAASTHYVPTESPRLSHIEQDVTPTERNESIRLNPTGDSYISSFPADANFGDADQLIVSVNQLTPQTNTRALLHFDLSKIPVGSVINRAELRLHQLKSGGGTWAISVAQVVSEWDPLKVTWGTQPKTDCCQTTEILPQIDGETTIAFTVQELVQRWVTDPGKSPNLGLALIGEGGRIQSRTFSSAESKNPPELIINFAPPTQAITIPQSATVIDVDGFCNTDVEYRDALQVQYGDFNGQIGTIYLQHSNKYLFVCVRGPNGVRDDRFFRLYLDIDHGQEQFAEEDDIGLELGPLTQAKRDVIGTGRGNYLPTTFPFTWLGSARVDVSNDVNIMDEAEYQVPLPAFERYCGASFGIAVYHHWMQAVGDDYGWPTNMFYDQPVTWVDATLAGRDCPRRIQVYQVDENGPSPVEGATVYRMIDVAGNSNIGEPYNTDVNGFVLDQGQIQVGDRLWILVPAPYTPSYPTEPDRARRFYTRESGWFILAG